MGTARKILAAIAALASLFSGLYWHLSAKAALDAAQATGTSPEALQAIHSLELLSLHNGLLAAYGAAVAGVALAVAVFLDP